MAIVCTCSFSSNCSKHPPVCQIADCPCCLKDSSPTKKYSPMQIKQYYESIIDSYKELIEKANNQKKKLIARMQLQQSQQNFGYKKLLDYMCSEQCQGSSDLMKCLQIQEEQDEQIEIILQNQSIIYKQSKHLQSKLIIGQKLMAEVEYQNRNINQKFNNKKIQDSKQIINQPKEYNKI